MTTALGQLTARGWAALDRDDEGAAVSVAEQCRRFAWEQPDDVPGVLLGWDDDHPAEPMARAHSSGQPYGDIGAAVAFLARSFEQAGDVDDLDAAVELHDLVVALGEGVWAPSNALVGWGSALLYEITGEDAFLATAERIADVLCETQSPSGAWGDDDALTGLAAETLVAMADAVEARASVEERE
ncbi:MAG: hypothetical protein JO148_05740 [Acidimicrobiia bacterium]|nr:hypothetical protein [Acidimicrobiia bacterium]